MTFSHPLCFFFHFLIYGALCFRHSVQATKHQGLPDFKAAGKQCVYNAIASMVFNETQPVNEWTCQHLDKIMKEGDWLYTNLQRDNSYPLIPDIPKSIWLGCILNEIQTGATIFGPLHSENFTFSRLDDITSSLAKYNIVTIDSHVPAYSCALNLDDSSRCFIFDSHSRNENGLCSPDGKATLTQHNKSNVVNFIRQQNLKAVFLNLK